MNHRDAMRQASPQHSPGLPSARLATNGNGLSSSLSSSGARYYNHHRANSSESNLSNIATAGSVIGSGPPSGRPFDNRNEIRRNGYDGSRPPPVDVAGRHSSAEIPASAKEHKGFLPKFMRRDKKRDENHASPDESSVDSPTSPAGYRHMPPNAPFAKSAMNSSYVSLNERPP